MGKYLGIPIFHERVNKNTFQFVLDKVNQCLSSWKAKTLSLAGRVTLTKSVLQALPSHVMQSCVIPKGVCDDIDKICRSFIRGEEQGQRRFHPISWERICQSKKDGGLGLPSMRDLNLTCMMKVAWKLSNTLNALWQEVLRGKYNTGRDGFLKIDCKKAGSNLWKGISSNWEVFGKNLQWRLRDGETVRFWEDYWILNEEPLVNSTIQPLNDNLCHRRVSDFATNNGEWDYNILEEFLPANIV